MESQTPTNNTESVNVTTEWREITNQRTTVPLLPIGTPIPRDLSAPMPIFLNVPNDTELMDRVREAKQMTKTVKAYSTNSLPVQLLSVKERTDAFIEELESARSPICRICGTQAVPNEMDGCERCPFKYHKCCKSCYSIFWQTNIFSGRADQLMCIGWGECEAKPSKADLQRILSERTYRKYLYFLQKKRFEDQNVVFCEQDMCWEPIMINDQTTGTETCVQCKACKSFTCKYCNALAKDPNHQCVASRQAQLESKKQAAPKLKLVSHVWKPGEVVYESTTQGVDENGGLRNSLWYVLHTKKCPNKHCGARIEKDEGCDGMVCTHCNYYFCWRCRRSLNEVHPIRRINVVLPESQSEILTEGTESEDMTKQVTSPNEMLDFVITDDALPVDKTCRCGLPLREQYPAERPWFVVSLPFRALREAGMTFYYTIRHSV